MADAPAAPPAETPAAPAKKPKLPIIIAAAAIAVLAAGGGAYFFMNKGGDHEAAAEEQDTKQAKSKDAKSKAAKPKGPAVYVEFDPPFVVNFEARGMVRFLQITAKVMTHDAATVELIKQHDPVLRNDLLLLFGSQTYDAISTREGKEQLRKEALQSIAKVIDAEGGDGKSVEQLYFTSFVMQ